MVEQLGFAMIPGLSPIASEFTSGTTSGISFSIRYALLLSITTQFDLTAAGANSRLIPAPAEKSAISIFTKEFCRNSSTAIFSPLNSKNFPAERVDANSLRSSTGKFLSSKIASIFLPTAPVAPAIAIWYFSFFLNTLSSPVQRLPNHPSL